jgi:N-acetylmuramic acid 6-phosphate etherase
VSELPATEARDAATDDIDRLDDLALAQLLVETHRGAIDAALAVAEDIARAIGIVADALERGNRVAVIGAGTSGRLAVLDAAELPPTFGLEPGRVEGWIAGGDAALRRAVEGAEDDAVAGAQAGAALAAGDVAIGVSASGGAPFVRAALDAAHGKGAHTIAIVNSAQSALTRGADVAIVAQTGAEPIAGSTRLRAGTAQKINLNAISTGAMVRLGKTYGNLMVDVVASNAKLRARSERLVAELGPSDDPDALLAAAGGSVKTAIVMARLGLSRGDAEARLRDARGRLGDALSGPG